MACRRETILMFPSEMTSRKAFTAFINYECRRLSWIFCLSVYGFMERFDVMSGTDHVTEARSATSTANDKACVCAFSVDS